MLSQKIVLLYTTIDSQQAAISLAKGAVEAGLAACVNYFTVQSVYRWQGNLEQGEEWSLRFKTTVGQQSALQAWIKANHAYDLPALWWIEVEADEAYRDYVNAC